MATKDQLLEASERLKVMAREGGSVAEDEVDALVRIALYSVANRLAADASKMGA